MKNVIFLCIALLLLTSCTKPDYLTRVEAYEIAQNSQCMEIGTLSTESFYNSNSKTWWIDLNTYEKYPNCNPACVVYEENKSTQINWRCTGLIEE